jgi:hypothetical protein
LATGSRKAATPRTREGDLPPRAGGGEPGGEGSGGSVAGEAAATVSLPKAWARILEEPQNLPKGALPFLRAAKVEFPEEGGIRILLPPGPGLERLEEPAALRTLRRALSPHAGGEPKLEVRELPGEDGHPPRITEETVRNGRLKELVDKEPSLGEAVKELDLELMD